MKTVCFACVHNAGRSQMAAALWNALGDPTRTRAISAVRAIRDDIEDRVRALLTELDLAFSG